MHFTRYNMSAPWRLCLTSRYLCPKQTKWHVPEEGSLTSDLYILPCLKVSWVQSRTLALIFRGSHLFSLYQHVSIKAVNPALVIRLSEAAEWEQRRRAFSTSTTFWTYCHTGDLSAQHSGHHIISGLAWIEAFIGSLSMPRAACFDNVRVLIKMCYVAAAHLSCYCSCPTTNSVSNRRVRELQ